MRIAAGVVFAICCVLPATANAASVSVKTATIVADNIFFAGDGSTFIADGNIEVFWGEETLRAARLEYRDDILQIAGPITLTTEDQALILASAGQISADLQNGIMESVQVLLARDVQMAANKIERRNGRFYRLNNAVVTTCKVCSPGDQPLWHYRARYVIHDTEAQQLYLGNAQLVVGDFALPAIPLLRMPDPTVRRQTGFLFPSVHLSKDKGFEVEVPYFLTLGDHADLTFLPRVSTKKQKSLHFEYRRRFSRGLVNLEGSFAYGESATKNWQSKFGINGAWDLGDSYKLSFDGEKVSSKEYFNATDLTMPSRLESYARITRRRENSFFDATGTYYKPLKDQDTHEPNIAGSVSWSRKLSPPGIGGTTGFSLGMASYYRPGNGDVVGRDVTRGTVAMDWTKTWATGNGLLIAATGVVALHAYSVRNDPDFARSISTTSQTTALEFRWPLRKGTGEQTDVLEPFAQVVWSPSNPDNVPNEDSRIVEFDQTNLVSLNRFSGMDRSETGARLNVGVKHTRIVPGTMEWEALFGRVFRNEDRMQFSAASGLAGRRSDYVGALELKFASGLGVKLSILFDDDIDVSKTESLVKHAHSNYKWSVGYSYLEQDETLGMESPRDAWFGDSEFGLGQNWFTTATVKYDRYKTERSADVGLIYRQQCAEFAVSVLHELATDDLPKKNTYSLSVSLNKFGDDSQSPTVDQVCS